MDHGDSMSLSMFWAGALMVFVPVIYAALVIGFWWRWKKKQGAGASTADRQT